MENNKSEFCWKDEFGLFGGDNISIPYVGVRITKEQATIVNISSKAEIYETDGLKTFKIKGEDGKESSDYMVFILFR